MSNSGFLDTTHKNSDSDYLVHLNTLNLGYENIKTLRTTSFGINGPLMAFSVNKNYSLNPNFTRGNTLTQEIQLKSPSTITVIVNNRPMGIHKLAQGTYQFTSFPGLYGRSIIEFLVSENKGVTYSITKKITQNPSVLGKGDSEYGIEIGAPYTGKLLRGITIEDQLHASLRYKRGINRLWGADSRLNLQPNFGHLTINNAIMLFIHNYTYAFSASRLRGWGTGYSHQFSTSFTKRPHTPWFKLPFQLNSISLLYYNPKYLSSYTTMPTANKLIAKANMNWTLFFNFN